MRIVLADLLGKRKCRRNLIRKRFWFLRWNVEGKHVWKVTRAEKVQGIVALDIAIGARWKVYGICTTCHVARRVYVNEEQLGEHGTKQLRELARA